MIFCPVQSKLTLDSYSINNKFKGLTEEFFYMDNYAKELVAHCKQLLERADIAWAESVTSALLESAKKHYLEKATVQAILSLVPLLANHYCANQQHSQAQKYYQQSLDIAKLYQLAEEERAVLKAQADLFRIPTPIINQARNNNVIPADYLQSLKRYHEALHLARNNNHQQDVEEISQQINSLEAEYLLAVTLAFIKEKAANAKMQSEEVFAAVIKSADVVAAKAISCGRFNDALKLYSMLKNSAADKALQQDGVFLERLAQLASYYLNEKEPPRVKSDWLSYREELQEHRSALINGLTLDNVLTQQAEFNTAMKAFTQQLIQDCIALLGDSPCDYCFIGLGSHARGEMSLYSDIECALLVDTSNLTESEKARAKRYFDALLNLLRFKIESIGESLSVTEGYRLDPGLNPLDAPTLRGTPQEIIANNFPLSPLDARAAKREEIKLDDGCAAAPAEKN